MERATCISASPPDTAGPRILEMTLQTSERGVQVWRPAPEEPRRFRMSEGAERVCGDLSPSLLELMFGLGRR